MIPYRALPVLACTLLLCACGLKAPLLLPTGTAAGTTPAPGSNPPTDTPLCAGGTTNASVQGVCQ